MLFFCPFSLLGFNSLQHPKKPFENLPLFAGAWFQFPAKIGKKKKKNGRGVERHRPPGAMSPRPGSRWARTRRLLLLDAGGLRGGFQARLAAAEVRLGGRRLRLRPFGGGGSGGEKGGGGGSQPALASELFWFSVGGVQDWAEGWGKVGRKVGAGPALGDPILISGFGSIATIADSMAGWGICHREIPSERFVCR